ncbi:heat shock factor 2-binding protein [Amazona ochrocephala]
MANPCPRPLAAGQSRPHRAKPRRAPSDGVTHSPVARLRCHHGECTAAVGGGFIERLRRDAHRGQSESLAAAAGALRRRAGLAGDAQKAEPMGEFVKIRRRDLERLTTEVMQLRDFLPKIINADILGTFQKLDAIQSNVEKKEEEIEQLKMDCEHFRARLETAQADCMKEKKEKLDVRQQLNEAKQQLLQQAEYCTEMGAAVCTLLWGVSSNEEAVKTILGGTKAVKFFTITAQTMESFVKSLSEDMKQQDLDSDENQFVLALAGIVTNVAALACGREFLVSSSRELLDTMMHLLGDMKPGLCTKFKVLMLMSLYNVSINLKGLKYISESPGFIPLLWWLLNDPDTEVCLHVLRLLQSVILEPEVLAKSASEMRDTLPFQRIIALSKSRNADLQALAKELLEDLKILEYEA